MFGKDKKSESTSKTLFTDTESEARVDFKPVSNAEADHLRDLYSAVTSSANALSRRYVRCDSTTSYSEPFVGPSLMDIYKLCFEIRNNTAGYMDICESIEYIIKALEARECPVDDCKKCKYYQPGNVEKCDTNRMLAEYLVNGEFVRGIRPKPIDKPEEK